MAVPAHDERDFEFATKYGVPIRQGIRGARESELLKRLDSVGDLSDEDDFVDAPANQPLMKELESVRAGCVTEHGTLINSGEYDGLDFEQAFEAITARFEQAGTGSRRVNFRLRDWGVSRQRRSEEHTSELQSLMRI